MSAEEIYNQRYKKHLAEAEILKNKSFKLSLGRLGYFVAAIGLLIFLFNWNFWFGIIGIFILLPLFHQLIQYHVKIQKAETHHRNLASVNNLEHQFVTKQDYSTFYDGNEFLDPMHNYADDFDLFGPYSIFQFLNRCNSQLGYESLANALLHPSVESEIVDKQKAIEDLKLKIDWRQDLQAHGMGLSDKAKDRKDLLDWLDEEDYIRENALLKIGLYVIPLLTIIGFVALFYYYGPVLCLLAFLPAGLLLKKYLNQINQTHSRVNKSDEVLKKYGQLIGLIEEENFNSALLKKLQAPFILSGSKASEQLSKLSYAITQLNVRNNPFSFLFNIFGLWDFHWIHRLEKWKKQHGSNLKSWIEILAQFEMYSSLANFAYNNPNFIFPKVESGLSSLQASELGHPLIPEKDRVCNDLDMPLKDHIRLITGSNMGGKSTFLRTVGINMVLAMAGSVVCAKTLAFPLRKIYSSMRTRDALSENTSSFYAELKRLKVILDAAESEGPIFFLLDEILKGTNSKDRHTGSKALIKQLISSSSAGLISTHDLELGTMEKEMNGQLENWCFEVDVQDGELSFEYKIKPGVSKSFNATQLMKDIGIKIDS